MTDVVQTGQQIWVRQVGDARWLAQVPDVNSALVSINPQNGAVLALVGGFDFNQSKFNRATGAARQVGSNIKPFLYTAAMDKGLTLASILNDVPISLGCRCRFRLAAEELAGGIRRPYSLFVRAGSVEKRGDGACNACDGRRLRGRVSNVFGFPAQNIVRTESLALGSASFTPLQVARGGRSWPTAPDRPILHQ